jgi:hypothetical protein
MCREAVAQTVARRRFGNGGDADGFLNRSLQAKLFDVMPSKLARARIGAPFRRRKDMRA